jgi:hypothetical protein
LKEVAQSLGAVLSEFETSQNPEQFKLVQGQTSFHILPARSAVSENRVSVTVDDTPAGNVVQTITKELARVSGAQIGIWRQPLNLMKRRIRVDLASEPAYEVLSRVLQAVDSRLSWHLFYDVNLNTYLLTIYRPQS